MSRKYKAKALHEETNQVQTLSLSGNSKEEIKELLINSGFVEPFDIKEIGFMPPTEAQLKYAKDLGIIVPEGISKSDISVLIDRKTANDRSDPNKELVEFAAGRGLTFSDYIGKKALYNLIWNSLSGQHKIAFFTFCIYRWLSDDRAGNLDKHPKKEFFYELAKDMEMNGKFNRSLENYSGQDLRFFGTLQFADGGDTQGGSIQTIAYKTAAAFLKVKLGLVLVRKKSIPSKDDKYKSEKVNSVKKTEASGKPGFGCWILMLLFFILIFWGFYHLVFNVWLGV